MKQLLGTLLLTTCLAGAVQTANAQARVQVIHNSPDAAAAVVDVWLNNTLLIDDFAFRTATPFVNAPAGTPIDITICGPASTDTTAEVARYTLTLTNNATYVIVANGIVSPTGYMPMQPFGLDIYAAGRETAVNPANTDVLICHGSTDAPTVDVIAPLIAPLADDLAYGTFNTAGYAELATADYPVQIRNQQRTDVVAEYSAPLQTLGLQGAAITVVASGFLNPANNSNGPAFGLYAATAAGGPLVALPSAPVSTARVQVIHNCADLAAASVDIWLNNTLLLDNFAFRTASPFIDAPAGAPFDITVCGPASTDTTAEVARITYTLTPNAKYILVAGGIVSTTGYSPVQPFAISVYPTAREAAGSMTDTDILVYHGATDAPTVDVEETFSGSTLVNDLAYAAFDGYLSLPANNNYSVSVTDQTGNTTVASYGAPLQVLGLGGQAITVLASGFLNPASNSNGAAFGLWVATAAGGQLIPLPVTTAVTETAVVNDVTLYPVPATQDVVTIAYTLAENTNLVNRIVDMQGRVVREINSGMQAAGAQRQDINIASLPNGIYTIQFIGDGMGQQFRFQVAR